MTNLSSAYLSTNADCRCLSYTHTTLCSFSTNLDCALPTFVTESRPQQSKTVDKIADTATHQWSRGFGSSRSRCRIKSDFIISILLPGNKGPDENKDNYKNYLLTPSIAGAIHLSVFTVHCIALVRCRLSLSIGLVSPGKSCRWWRSVTQSVIF